MNIEKRRFSIRLITKEYQFIFHWKGIPYIYPYHELIFTMPFFLITREDKKNRELRSILYDIQEL